MNWQDETSYSQNGKREVKTVVFYAGDLKIVVTRHIDYGPDVWLLNCEPFFTRLQLHSKDLDAAKEEALGRVRTRLARVALALGIV